MAEGEGMAYNVGDMKMLAEMVRVCVVWMLWLCCAAVAGEHAFLREDGLPRWSAMTAQQVMPDVEAAVAESQQCMQAIASLRPEEATFENTFLAYDAAEEDLKQLQVYLYHLVHTMGSAEYDAAHEQVIAAVAAYEAQRPAMSKIYALMQQVAQQEQGESEEKRLFMARTLQQLRDAGAALSATDAARKVEIEAELKRQYIIYQQNIAQGCGNWELQITERAALDGMSDAWLERTAAAAASKGYGTAESPVWLLTVQDAAEVLRYCRVEETRRLCWLGCNATGTAHAADNEPVIHRILSLRRELAELCGYKSYADMRAASLMMGSAEQALAFVDDLLQQSKPAHDAWVQQRLAHLSAGAGKALTELAPWDEAYYAQQAPPREQPGFNLWQLSPYLGAENVFCGMQQIWGRLYGLRFSECATRCGDGTDESAVEVWHPTVRVLAVHDAATDALLGYCYFDLYPRNGKRGMTWCMPLRFGDTGEPHLACVVANMSPPPAEGAHCINIYDVYALFHEFGHALHFLLGHTELRATCATSVEFDFVETPSQVQEYWAWEPQALALLAKNPQTGEEVPADLLQGLAESRRTLPIEEHIHMLCLAKLDLELHAHYRERFEGRALDAAAAELLRPWSMPYTHATPCAMRNFVYCMTEGYDACFYTYKWSELMAMDVFARFAREGLLNAETGMQYRRAVLERGGAKPARQLFEDFMGRAPKADVMLRCYGLPGDAGSRGL